MYRFARRSFKYLAVTISGILGFAALYFGAAFVLSRIAVPKEDVPPGDIEIFIKTNGAHTDIVVPVRNGLKDWSREIKYANNISRDTVYRYLAVGWGDKGFYLDTPTWAELKTSVAFRASFWLGTTAMHATYYKDLTEDATCRRILLNEDQYRRLAEFMTARFRTDGNGNFINIETDAVYGLTDAFYEARGRYNLFYTCNTWANDALKACGQRRCVWTIFDKGIFLKYR